MLAYIVRQARGALFAVDPNRCDIGLRGFRFFLCTGRTPRSRAEPRRRRILRIAVQRGIHRKQAKRTARLLHFVHVAGIQRHGNGIRLVRSRVPEFFINQYCNWNQRRLAIWGHLKHGNRARARIFFSRGFAFSRNDLRPIFLRVAQRREAPHQSQNKKSKV